MKSTFAVLSLFGAAVSAASAPECKEDVDGQFEVTVASVTSKRHVLPRAECGGEGTLVLTLKGGDLKDAQQRSAYIASNGQFQFDQPAQKNAKSVGGYCVYGNGTLALNGTPTFLSCDSGGFSNLYSENDAAQCKPVQMITMPCGAGSGSATGTAPAAQGSDGQAVATAMVTTTIVKPLSDGQPQVITTVVPVPMCQIGDGQVQAHTTPCASVPAGAPVSEKSDGQPQVTATGAPVSEKADGQPQVTATGAPVSEKADGQPQVTATGAPVSQKPDGQPNAATTVASIAPVSSAPAQTTAVATVSGADRLTVGSVAAVLVGLVGAVYLW